MSAIRVTFTATAEEQTRKPQKISSGDHRRFATCITPTQHKNARDKFVIAEQAGAIWTYPGPTLKATIFPVRLEPITHATSDASSFKMDRSKKWKTKGTHSIGIVIASITIAPRFREELPLANS